MHLGSDYGGWSVPLEIIRPSWTCYTVGLGEDATFDIALSELGCDVLAVDPTPRAATHVEGLLARYPKLSFAPVALASADGTRQFFPPENPAHVSFSLTNRQKTSRPMVVETVTLASLAARNGHTVIDLIKLDIEGAEYDVVPLLPLTDYDVKVLCIEFHPDVALRNMIACAATVRRRNFEVVSVRRTDITFVRADLT